MVLNMYTYILNEYLESWLSPKVEKQIVKQHHYIERSKMNSKLMYHLWFPRLVVYGATSLTDIIGNLLGLDLRELQDCACLSMLESATVITKY